MNGTHSLLSQHTAARNLKHSVLKGVQGTLGRHGYQTNATDCCLPLAYECGYIRNMPDGEPFTHNQCLNMAAPSQCTVTQELQLTGCASAVQSPRKVAGCRWGASSGSNSKFGMHQGSLRSMVDLLQQHGLLSSTSWMHFHIGSQVPFPQPPSLCPRVRVPLYEPRRHPPAHSSTPCMLTPVTPCSCTFIHPMHAHGTVAGSVLSTGAVPLLAHVCPKGRVWHI